MLFVNGSHPLSPYIYSLNSKFGNMPDKDRVEIKEKLDPSPSGGMNGYIALCAGDPSPPVFRSPVDGLEDIMDNQVICSVYKLPDPHKHIARPPAGVIIPKKSVEAGDLKPPPVLWHEDSGRRPHDNNNRRPYDNNNRRPHDNNRQNPAGALSGRQLGEAAHRLVVNSLNVRGGGQHNAPSMPYQTIMNGTNYSNGRHHMGNQGVPPRMEQPAGHSGWHVPSDNMTNGQAAYGHQHERAGPSRHERDNRGRQHYHPYARDNHHDSRGRVPPPPGYHQNHGNSHAAAPSAGPGWYGQPPPAYAGGYQPAPYGAQQWQQQPYGGGAPPTRPNSQQSQNRYGTLDRGSNKRPSSHGRY